MSAHTGSANEQPQQEERTCRICLDSEDPLLGRLIRPCLCKGSISYVHVKCLQRWRNASTSQSAFYACPQCHYKYAFARTRALGIASNPVFVGILSALFFTSLVLCASFVATFFIEGVDDPDTGYGYYYYWSRSRGAYDVASDLMKTAFRFLRDEDILIDKRRPKAMSPSLNLPPRTGPPSVLMRFFQRFVLGLPVVGAVSLVHFLWTMSLVGPLHFFTRWRGLRNTNRRDNGRDIATLLLVIAIAGGIIRALWKVYQLTERLAKRVLLRAEDAILEVNS